MHALPRPSRALAVVMTAAGILAAWRAEAQCIPSASALYWSIPVNGATQVPTNVTIWLAGTGLANASLAGMPLALYPNAHGPMVVTVAQPLPPRTHHALVVEIEQDFFVAHPESYPKDVTITFDTGDGPDESVPLAPTATAVTDLQSWAPGCTIVPDYCFDTGGVAAVQFPTSTAAQAWLVTGADGHSTPVYSTSHCGGPIGFRFDPQPDSVLYPGACWQLRAVDTAGRLSPATQVCDEPPQPSRGCDAGPASASIPGWLLVMLGASTAWWRRRRGLPLAET